MPRLSSPYLQGYDSRVLGSENDYLIRHKTKAIPNDNILAGKKLYPISIQLRIIFGVGN